MMGKTHWIAGAAAALAVTRWSGTTDPGVLILATAAGSIAALVPDWVQINLPDAHKKIKGAFGHRGITHWLWTALAVAWISTRLVPSPYPLAVLTGWGSHLLLDMIAGGIPLLWPLPRITVAHIKTGSRTDRFFGGAALVLLIIQALWIGLEYLRYIK